MLKTLIVDQGEIIPHDEELHRWSAAIHYEIDRDGNYFVKDVQRIHRTSETSLIGYALRLLKKREQDHGTTRSKCACAISSIMPRQVRCLPERTDGRYGDVATDDD